MVNLDWPRTLAAELSFWTLHGPLGGCRLRCRCRDDIAFGKRHFAIITIIAPEKPPAARQHKKHLGSTMCMQ